MKLIRVKYDGGKYYIEKDKQDTDTISLDSRLTGLKNIIIGTNNKTNKI